MITIKTYKKAESLEEAWELNQKRGNRVIGGMLWTKMSKANVQTAIDLSGLGLDTIEEAEDSFSIGAMVTLRQMEQHEGLNAYANGAVREAVRHIVGVQFRNLATVGGSIFGRYGFSDVLTVFLAMDAEVELYKAGRMSLREFAQRKADRDILVRVIVPKKAASFVYHSVRATKTDFPTLTCAAARLQDGWRFAVGARPMRAVVIEDEQGLLAGELTADKAAAFAKYAAETVPTSGNLRGSAAYRTHLTEVLVRRAVTELGGL